MRLAREYLLREIMALFALSLAVITILFMSQRIIQLTDWAVNRGVGLLDMSRFMIYLLPTVLLVIIPIVTLFSIMLAVGRWSSDNEITAWKASGVSIFRLFPPVALFAAFASALALFASQVMVPQATRAMRTLEWEIVETKTDASVTEGVFVNLTDDVTFYVRRKKEDGSLRGVMASIEQRDEKDAKLSRRQILFARSGRFVHDPAELANELWLEDGLVISEDRTTGRNDYLSFEDARVKIDIKRDGDLAGDEISKLDFYDTWDSMHSDKPLFKNPNKNRKWMLRLAVQFHERLAWPLGCLALCFWAVPLGLQPPRAGHARSIVVAIIVSALFYYLMILARFLAFNETVSPPIAMWIPDLTIFSTGLYMLRQKNNERPIFLLTLLEDWLYYSFERLSEYFKKRRKR